MIRKALLIFISIVCHAFASTPIVDISENDSRQTAPLLIFSDNKTCWKKELSKNYKILHDWIDSSTYFKHTEYVSPVIEFIAYLSAQIASSEDRLGCKDKELQNNGKNTSMALKYLLLERPFGSSEKKANHLEAYIMIQSYCVSNYNLNKKIPETNFELKEAQNFIGAVKESIAKSKRYDSRDNMSYLQTSESSLEFLSSNSLFSEEVTHNNEKIWFLNNYMIAGFINGSLKHPKHDLNVYEFMDLCERENIRCKQSVSFSSHNLEKWHDYIQWLFPINTKGMSPAPLITKSSLEVLKEARLHSNYETPFKTIMKFYGQELDENSGLYKTIEGVEGELALKNVIEKTHNYLRITRILAWLSLIDDTHYLKHFEDFIKRMQSECKTKYPDKLQYLNNSLETHWKHYFKNSELRKNKYANTLEFVKKCQDESKKNKPTFTIVNR